MKAFFDTSVLVAAIVRSHPQHGLALPWLAQARSGEIQLLVASHSLAELYSVLSTLPIRPKIAPSIAWRLVQENVGTVANLIALSAPDYLETLQRVSELGLSGGIVYDALLARAAEISGAERLLTFNRKHFERVWPEGRDRLLSP